MMEDKSLSLSFDHPLDAVFLRNLAWERYVANKSGFRRKDIIDEQVNAARKELSLKPHKDEKSGAPHDFIGKLTRSNMLIKKPSGIELANGDEWEQEWRLLHIPPHNTVRESSYDPIISSDDPDTGTLSISLRDTSLPHLRIYYGEGLNNLSNARGKGVYFLRLQNDLYIGKTDEMETRVRSHIAKKKPSMWVFMSPEVDVLDGTRQLQDRYSAYTDGIFSLDALNVTESLLISFWNEVCHLDNSNRGADKRPPFYYLQQGISVVKACSAVIMWLSRERWASNTPWKIPFKMIAGGDKWGEQYLGG